uniref:WAGO-2 n=1 Tax=Ascaris suum TaxID=6253 RepID=F1KSL9_ASCSU|nr:WAGO-2 [Ascaris suum]
MIDINIKKSKGDAEGGSSPESSGNSHTPPSNGSGNDDQKKMRKSLKKTTAKLKKLAVSEATPIMADKMPGGTLAADEVLLATNVYGIRLPPIPVFRYDVTVVAYASRRMFELTKQSRDDYRATERKAKCLAIFNALRNDAFFGGEGNVVYYDCQKILYSFSRLGNGETQGTLRHVLTLSQEALESLKMGDVEKVEFTVSDISGDSDLVLSDISRISSNLSHSDHSLMQFIDIATSQYALFHPDRHLVFGRGVSYLQKPWEEGFRQEDCPSLPEGKYVCVGTHKSAGRVEGPKGRGSCNAAITIDTAKTAFHRKQNVMEKAFEIVPNFGRGYITQSQIFQLRQQMKGLFAMTRINGKNGSIFQITNISAQSARETTFIYEDVNVTVEQYYMHKYRLELKYAQAPLLVSRKSPSHTSYFPMEISYILENQRVQKQQQTATQLKGMREACVIPPAKRLEQNSKNLLALNIMNPDDNWIAKAGIRIIPKPLTVTGRVLPAPTILYGGNISTHVDQNKMAWTLGHNSYIKPVEVTRWAAYLVTGNGRDFMGEREFREFLSKFIQTGKSRGMYIADPLDLNRIRSTVEDIDKTVRIAAREGCDFLLFVQNDSAALHNAIKDVERKYEVVTQDVKMSTAMDVVRKKKWQTMENIVNKTNVKLGGLNHAIVATHPGAEKWFSDGRLFVGLSMSHSGPTSSARPTPSVIGYAANMGPSQFEFIGDFGFQTAGRTDNVEVLSEFMGKIFKHYMEKRGRYPTQLIIYRGGVSEGQFAMVLQYEVPLIRAAAKEAGCTDVKLTLIVANRFHNVRLIPSNVNPRDRASSQNIRPGTVVDTQLVHPAFSEFYLNSHRALQGTAKTPRYTIIVDDSRFEMDEVEGMTFCLCFCHQIVAITTSLPTPLYVASQYAERGRRLLIQRNGGQETSSSSSGEAGHLDIEAANKELPYSGSRLAELRVNA